MDTLLGLITARGGSKGIPGKTLKLLGGRPLIAYTIEAAQQAGVFDRVILSTDDHEIAEAARALGCEVPFLRPAVLARDETRILPVIQHAIDWLARDGFSPDRVMLLQPTSPLRRPQHIREALPLLAGVDSVVSVVAIPTRFHPSRAMRIGDDGRVRLFLTGNDLRHRLDRRQELSQTWTTNGAIYLFWSKLLLETEPNIYGRQTRPYPMPEWASVDIDTMEDWHTAEGAIRALGAIAQAIGPSDP